MVNFKYEIGDEVILTGSFYKDKEYFSRDRPAIIKKRDPNSTHFMYCVSIHYYPTDEYIIQWVNNKNILGIFSKDDNLLDSLL